MIMITCKTGREIAENAVEWFCLPDEELRLRMGELSAQDIRNIRAVLRAVLLPLRRKVQEGVK